MALYIFQFGLLQPLASVAGSQLVVVGFTLVLLIVMVANNRFRLKTYVYHAFILITVYVLMCTLANSSSISLVLSSYLEFLAKGFSGFVFGSLDVDSSTLFNAFFKVAIVNFTILVFKPLGLMSGVNYMRFGYAMVPSAIMFWYGVFRFDKFRLLSWFLALFTTGLTIIYGSRGALVVLMLFFSLTITKSDAVSKQVKVLLVISCLAVIFLFLEQSLLLRLLDFLNYSLGIRAYALSKFRMMIVQGIAESSSGRDVLYGILWESFLKNPVFGNGIFYSSITYGFTPHNIFIQILVESGIIGLLFWLLIWLFCNRRYLMIAKEDRHLFEIASLIIRWLCRLLFSPDMVETRALVCIIDAISIPE